MKVTRVSTNIDVNTGNQYYDVESSKLPTQSFIMQNLRISIETIGKSKIDRKHSIKLVLCTTNSGMATL